MAEIKGQIERITYINEENGYVIAKLKTEGSTGLVTIVGTMPGLNPGEVLKLKGEWQTHPKYGQQFKFSSHESIIPATVRGIERYLSSGMIKGIGPVMAKRLVTNFGVKTLDVIENDIEKLKEVEGIGEKRVEMICHAWKAQKEIRQVMIFLQGHGVSPTYAVKMYKQYGNEAVSIVRDNPYRLAEEVFGIGFLTADKIAENVGISKDSLVRARAGVQYILNRLSDDGHVYYPFDRLIELSEKTLDIDRGIILTAIVSAASDRKIVIEESSSFDIPGERAVYLTRFHVSEVGIARFISELLSSPRQLPLVNKEQVLASAENKVQVALSDQQRWAVRDSLDSKVMVITGGPGTGKTTIIKAIIDVQMKMNRKVLLAAPTGRAAKRMTEATGQEAKTIHRLLEFSPKDMGFKRDEENPLDADAFIIDEVSMVDTTLMYYLLKAIPLQASLILVGDVDQLPSVGAGNVLRDVIESGVVPVVRLSDIFRQSKQSMIIVNAHKINHGEMPIIEGGQEYQKDFYFFDISEPEKALETIIELCRERIPRKYGFHSVDDIQVLTPMHRGTVGAANLNNALQKELNPSKEEIVRSGRVFKRGDKVMQIRNNYDKDVFNGDIGRIAKIDSEEQELTVNFDGKFIGYDFSELDEIILAYATSVHKSQGSEYPCIVMPVLTQHYMLLQRNLFYTGITRGKRLVVLVGTRKALSIAISNNKTQLRYSLLKERLKFA
jgi:exodeoxyribonuclease V alpha subunit